MSVRSLTEKLSLGDMASRLRSGYAASARRQVLGKVDTCLLLCEGQLINTVSGENRNLPATDPETVAAIARSLLGSESSPGGVLLLLPASAFVASSYSFAFNGDNLKSALSLQIPALLPAYEKSLQLAVNSRFSSGVALFYPEALAEGWFQAFAGQSLNLVALMPRVLAAADRQNSSGPCSLLDVDDGQQTLVTYADQTIRQWLPVCTRDLQDEQFNAQWQQALASAEGETLRLDQGYWQGFRGQPQLHSDYCFYPAGAINHGKQLLARKQKTLSSVAAGVLVFLLALPFISNWVQLGWYSYQVSKYRELSVEARSSQTAVYDMEDEWGVVADFPQQDAASMLLSLNELIDSSLSSFILSKGELEIRGVAQDPALLIEQLEEQDMFFNVAQSRSSDGGSATGRGDRFGIRMNITGVDFPAWEEAHPESEH